MIINKHQNDLIFKMIQLGNLHSESVSPICSLMNRNSASVNSGVSGGTWDEDLLFCWLPV